MTHKELLLNWFKDHRTITPMEALKELGIYRLGARVFDLRGDGHVIDTDLVEVRDRHGNVSHPARYTYLGKAT